MLKVLTDHGLKSCDDQTIKNRTNFKGWHCKQTNYIIDGKAEVWLENDEGIVEKKILQKNDFFTVFCVRTKSIRKRQSIFSCQYFI